MYQKYVYLLSREKSMKHDEERKNKLQVTILRQLFPTSLSFLFINKKKNSLKLENKKATSNLLYLIMMIMLINMRREKINFKLFKKQNRKIALVRER